MKFYLKGRGAGLFLVLIFLWCIQPCTPYVYAYGQQVTVSGTVVDETGNTMPGVNVVVAETPTGAVTDVNGRYSLSVPSGNVKLVFSSVGYVTKEVETNGATTVNVTMQEDVSEIEEVVVVGYGFMTRKDVTSSITTVTSENLNVGVYSNPAELLQGKVPGLIVVNTSDPNANPSITLRGSSSFRSGAAMEPYYIVDGIPGVSLSLVAPEDIESIDVLRDASATAIYGSKAANGVIIVTTKKGKAGTSSISYSGYVAANFVMNKYEMMNAEQLRRYHATSQNTNPNWKPLPNDLGFDTNWQNEVQRTGFSHNHNFSINGGTQQTSYNASVNYLENKGTIKGSDMNRLIGRVFVQSKALNDRLTVSFNVNASINKRNGVPASNNGESVFDAMHYYSPLVPVRNDDGTFYENPTSQNFNPVALIYENTNYQENKRIQGTGKASLRILDGLVYHASLSYQNEQTIISSYNNINSLLTIGMNGRARRSAVMNDMKVFENYLNFDKTFNQVHKIALMAGYSWEESNDNDGFRITATDFYNDDLKYFNMALANKIGTTTGGANSDLGDYRLSTLRMISYFGRVNYSYNSKYLFQASLRRDGSSAFGKNNRWATFPSASVAWRLSEEHFIKHLNIFDDLKLRVGYGVSGNSLGFDVFTATQLYGSTGRFLYVSPSGEEYQIHVLGPTRNANPDLKWESTGMFNVGVDFAFFKNRLSATIEYYSKRTKDLIANYAVSTTRYPFGTMTANVGEISNKGIELMINAVPVKTKDFRWQTSINLSHNKNKVISISNDMYSVDYFDQGTLNAPGFSGAACQRIQQGGHIGQFYTFLWAGVKDDGTGPISHFYVYSDVALNEVYKDEEGGHDGKVTKQSDGRYIDNATGEYVTTSKPQDRDRVPAGSAQPKLFGGWNNTVSYKNWTMTAFFQGVYGNKIMNYTRANLCNVSIVAQSKNPLAWCEGNIPITDSNAHAPSDYWIEDGSYLRLSTLTFGYNFGRINDYIRGLRLYVTCNNVLTVTGYKGNDPEVSLGGVAPGIDNRQTYPRTRTLMFGVNVNL